LRDKFGSPASKICYPQMTQMGADRNQSSAEISVIGTTRADEANLLARARASALAGHVVPEAAVDAWIDSLGTDRELPPPRSAR
jgi:hypothetical protein